MRPRNIILFERLFIAGFAVAILADAVDFPKLGVPAPVWLVATVQAMVFAVLAGLVLLVSRRRSRVAMWIIVFLFLLGLPITLNNLYVTPTRPGVWLVLLETAMQAVAVAYLFTKPAQVWMVER